jgi:hypothetical protein
MGWLLVRVVISKSERGMEEGRCFLHGSERGESLRGRKAQESIGPGPNQSFGRAVEGHGFSCGIKPLERRYEVCEGFVGKRRSGESPPKGEFDHGKGAKL